MRSVRWRRALGLLPASGGDAVSDAARCAETRAAYDALRSSLRSAVTDSGGDDDATANNPLAHAPDSGWAKRFRHEETAKQVDLDLARLHLPGGLGERPGVKAALRGVLCVYAAAHDDVSYRQGMHELAALLLLALLRDATAGGGGGGGGGAVAATTQPLAEPSSPEEAPLPPDFCAPPAVLDAAAGPVDARYVEHDTHALFVALLRFENDGDGGGGGEPACSPPPPRLPGVGVAAYYLDAPKRVAGSPQRPAPVHAALARVWAALKAVDQPLFDKLSDAGCTPQLFMLKWLRLLFGREFHPEDVLRVWDALIDAGGVAGPGPRGAAELVEAVCVAMILFLRPSLLECDDFGAMLRRLQRFPPLESVEALLERARAVAPAVATVSKRGSGSAPLPGLVATPSNGAPPPLPSHNGGARGLLLDPHPPTLPHTSFPPSLPSPSSHLAPAPASSHAALRPPSSAPPIAAPAPPASSFSSRFEEDAARVRSAIVSDVARVGTATRAVVLSATAAATADVARGLRTAEGAAAAAVAAVGGVLRGGGGGGGITPNNHPTSLFPSIPTRNGGVDAHDTAPPPLPPSAVADRLAPPLASLTGVLAFLRARCLSVSNHEDGMALMEEAKKLAAAIEAVEAVRRDAAAGGRAL